MASPVTGSTHPSSPPYTFARLPITLSADSRARPASVGAGAPLPRTVEPQLEQGEPVRRAGQVAVHDGPVLRACSRMTRTTSRGSRAKTRSRNSSGCSASTPCGSHAWLGKSRRLLVTIRSASAATATARTWRSFGWLDIRSIRCSYPVVIASSNALFMNMMRRSIAAGSIGTFRRTSSRIWFDQRGWNTLSSASRSSRSQSAFGTRTFASRAAIEVILGDIVRVGWTWHSVCPHLNCVCGHLRE